MTTSRFFWGPCLTHRDLVARLRAHGAELVQYDNSYRLCYVRGPEGILVALAEKIG